MMIRRGVGTSWSHNKAWHAMQRRPALAWESGNGLWSDGMGARASRSVVTLRCNGARPSTLLLNRTLIDTVTGSQRVASYLGPSTRSAAMQARLEVLRCAKRSGAVPSGSGNASKGRRFTLALFEVASYPLSQRRSCSSPAAVATRENNMRFVVIDLFDTSRANQTVII